MPTTLIPHICCKNAVEAIEFYQKAFGAEPQMVVKSPDGKLMHAGMKIDGATFYMVDEFPDFGANGPEIFGGSPVTMHLQVEDCDAVFQTAVEAGCEVKMPIADMFWGDRYGLLKDPYGHSWSVATTVREVTAGDIDKAMQEMTGEACFDGTLA